MNLKAATGSSRRVMVRWLDLARRHARRRIPMLSMKTAMILLSAATTVCGAAPGVVEMSSLADWQPANGWMEVGSVTPDPANPRALVTGEGKGILVSRGKAGYLLGREPHHDAKVEVEFMIPQGSNSGVYLLGSYEVQIFDSHGVAQAAYPGIECGGIYQEQGRKDTGRSPAVNAARPAGEWQSFGIVIRAARYDASGRKVRNACFESVTHNGRQVHGRVEVGGHTVSGLPEAPFGPLRLQGDHGPVAFRNIRITPLPGDDLPGDLAWRQTATSLALTNGGREVWRAVFDPKLPKPFVHPLATLQGEVLTAFEPADHFWHRGLWFSWKFVNGLNYWEEDKHTRKSEGLTGVTAAKAVTHPDFSATVSMDLAYRPPGKDPVMTEQRVLEFSRPDGNGNYWIDWQADFTVGAEPVVLERTPPPGEPDGKPWGGYAGLGVRLPMGIKGWAFTSSGGAKGERETHGKPAGWIDFSGPAAGVTMFGHPSNPRHPEPWYVSEALSYFGPAPLFREVARHPAGARFSIRHRILVHGPDGAKGVEKFGFPG
jgi:hypothetical protein